MSAGQVAGSDGNSLADWIAVTGRRVDAALEQALGRIGNEAPLLAEAMRYPVLAGGKRIRPLLVHAAAELGTADPAVVDGCAAAVELIHTYSLVHDDLPCMDDDALRRGRPTTHVVYGEAQALLAGDALQTLAFEVLAEALAAADRAGRGPSAATGLDMIAILARAAGAPGMAGGQSIDLASVGQVLDAPRLETMHRLKTGALLRASVALGATSADVAGEAVIRYADRIGLAFQVVDDILDVVADSGTLGKTAGKDAANDKPTYVSLLGIDGARAYAARLQSEALAAVEPFGPRGRRLSMLADLIVNRAS